MYAKYKGYNRPFQSEREQALRHLESVRDTILHLQAAVNSLMQDFNVLMDFHTHLKTRPKHNEVTQEGYRQLDRDIQHLTEEMSSSQIVLDRLRTELNKAQERVDRTGL